jgi:hypothetical protein
VISPAGEDTSHNFCGLASDQERQKEKTGWHHTKTATFKGNYPKIK